MEQAARSVINGEIVNIFRGNFDNYLEENRRFKLVMITLSPLEPFAMSYMLIAKVLGILGELCKLRDIIILK